MTPAPEDVAAFLGRVGDQPVLDLAGEHLPIVTQMVRAYVRDNGFDSAGNPGDDLAAVIVSSTARLASNPASVIEESHGIDDATMSTRAAIFNGWTLPELAVLHRHRKRAL